MPVQVLAVYQEEELKLEVLEWWLAKRPIIYKQLWMALHITLPLLAPNRRKVRRKERRFPVMEKSLVHQVNKLLKTSPSVESVSVKRMKKIILYLLLASAQVRWNWSIKTVWKPGFITSVSRNRPLLLQLISGVTLSVNSARQLILMKWKVSMAERCLIL